MKKVIGVMPLWDEEKNSIWMLPGYMEGIKQAGGLPFIFPFSEDEDEVSTLMEMCDGILFTGGHDISPDIYHEKLLEGLGSFCEKRDIMESIVLKQALEADKPILGICRGIQFINASLGGTLYQDLKLQHPSGVEHHQQAPYDVPAHDVILIEDTPLQKCIQGDSLAVNSYHHQAVKELAPDLKAMAVSSDGITEAVYMPGKKFLWAVQWHPEFLFHNDINSRQIFFAFINSI